MKQIDAPTSAFDANVLAGELKRGDIIKIPGDKRTWHVSAAAEGAAKVVVGPEGGGNAQTLEKTISVEVLPSRRG